MNGTRLEISTDGETWQEVPTVGDVTVRDTKDAARGYCASYARNLIEADLLRAFEYGDFTAFYRSPALPRSKASARLRKCL